jgi:hypothetical protein
MEAQTPQVYKAIAAVTKDMSVEGISKSRKNAQQGYTFRGIDEVYNALAPMLARHNLVILPRVVKREFDERQTKSGNPLFYTHLTVEFDFVSADDGSSHCVTTIGEAMDSADKSTNKAMSAAYKYACLQAFCIPTEGDNDSDGTTHEVAVRSSEPPQVFATSDERTNWLKQAVTEIAALTSYEGLMAWMGNNTAKLAALGENQTKAINDKLADAKTRLSQSPIQEKA